MYEATLEPQSLESKVSSVAPGSPTDIMARGARPQTSDDTTLMFAGGLP